MSWKLPRRMAPPGDATPNRADEEGRPLAAPTPRTDPQLLLHSKLLSSGVVAHGRMREVIRSSGLWRGIVSDGAVCPDDIKVDTSKTADRCVVHNATGAHGKNA